MIFLDYETRSRVDLFDCGGHVYAEDDSSEVLCCVALDVRVSPAVFYVWSPFPGPLKRWKMKPTWFDEIGLAPEEVTYAEPLLGTDDAPTPILQAAKDGVVFAAHNAWAFDEHIWNGLGRPRTEWIDTIPLCRRRGLPSALEQVSQVLFKRGKDKTGSLVMRSAMKPQIKRRGKRKEPKYLPDGRFAGEFLDPDGPRLSAIVRYCIRDVALMAQAFFSEGMDEPHPDDPVYEAHRKIDARGVAVDLDLTRLLLAVDQQSALAEVEACEVDLDTLRSPLALKAWLKARGVKVDDVKASTLKALLGD